MRQRGIAAAVENGKLTGYYRVRYAIQGNPLVSLCIPTNDGWSNVAGRGRINLVENFIKSIAAKIRGLSGLQSDGAELAQGAFGLPKDGSPPPSPSTACRATPTEANSVALSIC